jgi:hypothetical protein
LQHRWGWIPHFVIEMATEKIAGAFEACADATRSLLFMTDRDSPAI